MVCCLGAYRKKRCRESESFSVRSLPSTKRRGVRLQRIDETGGQIGRRGSPSLFPERRFGNKTGRQISGFGRVQRFVSPVRRFGNKRL